MRLTYAGRIESQREADSAGREAKLAKADEMEIGAIRYPTSAAKLLLAATLLVAASAELALAQGICTMQTAGAKYPRAAVAIDDWVQRKSIGVLPALKASIILDFCSAADSIATDKAQPPESIDVKARDVVTEYLDRMSDASKPARTIGSILRSQLGVAGFSRPQEKSYGVVRITYIHHVDTVSIEGSPRHHGPPFW